MIAALVQVCIFAFWLLMAWLLVMAVDAAARDAIRQWRHRRAPK